MKRRGYRAIRPSKRQREKLLEMNLAMYSTKTGDIVLPKTVKKSENGLPQITQFRDRSGNVQTVESIPNFSETEAFAEANSLWPDLEQRHFSKPSDSDWSEDTNMTGRNFAILEVVHMTKKGKQDYGNYYAMQGQDMNGVFFSILTRGQFVNEDLEKLSGIALETGTKEVKGVETKLEAGKRFADRQYPVWVRVEYEEAGAYDGYFILRPAVQELESSQ